MCEVIFERMIPHTTVFREIAYIVCRVHSSIVWGGHMILEI